MILFTGETLISSFLGLLLVAILLVAGAYGLWATPGRPTNSRSKGTPDPKPPLSPHSVAVGIVQGLIQAELLTRDKFKLATEITDEKLRAVLNDV